MDMGSGRSRRGGHRDDRSPRWHFLLAVAVVALAFAGYAWTVVGPSGRLPRVAADQGPLAPPLEPLPAPSPRAAGTAPAPGGRAAAATVGQGGGGGVVRGATAPLARSTASEDAVRAWAREHGEELSRVIDAAQRARTAAAGPRPGLEAACRRLTAALLAPYAAIPNTELEPMHASLRASLGDAADRCEAAVSRQDRSALEDASSSFKRAESTWAALRPRLVRHFE